jgi:hypothetical protein
MKIDYVAGTLDREIFSARVRVRGIFNSSASVSFTKLIHIYIYIYMYASKSSVKLRKMEIVTPATSEQIFLSPASFNSQRGIKKRRK